MDPGTQTIVVTAAAAATLLAAVPFHLWNCRKSGWPIQARAVVDTTMHGLTPTIALAPAWLSPQPDLRLGLFVFLCGFLLDLDHVIAFRSVSLVKCSTQERRPFGHSATFILAYSAAVGAIFMSLAAGAMCLFAASTHVLFDATDRSGVPALWPSMRIIRSAPIPAYCALLAAGLALSAAFRLT